MNPGKIFDFEDERWSAPRAAMLDGAALSNGARLPHSSASFVCPCSSAPFQEKNGLIIPPISDSNSFL